MMEEKISGTIPPLWEEDPSTVENIDKRVRDGFKEIFVRFKGRSIDDEVLQEFSVSIIDMMRRVSEDIGEEDPTKYVRVVVIRPDDGSMTTLLVDFEPKTPRLRNARTVVHRRSEEGRAPIYCAYIDPLKTISGWGPTPFHAMADLEKHHGDKENH